MYAGKTERTGSKNTQTAVGRCGAGAGRAGTLPAGCTTGAGRAEYEKYCFPLDTAVWRISDVYGKRIDPLPAKLRFIRARPCLCGGYSGAGSAGWCGDCGGIQPKLRQPSAHPAPGWLRDPLRAPAIPLCPPGRGGTGRADAGHSGADRARHRCAPASELWQQGAACDPAALLETAP